MKQTIFLIASAFYGLTALGQSSVNAFFTNEYPAYAYVTSATPFDQNVSGPEVEWTLSGYEESGWTESSFFDPTAEESATYPNTTRVYVTTGTLFEGEIQNRLFCQESGNEAIVTGSTNSLLVLNYETDPASLGTFPKNYNDSFFDTTAGTFVSLEYGYEGTFEGTVTTMVDAYGTLTSNVGTISAGTPVTRMKTIQDIDLYVSPFGLVGNAVLITNTYHGNGYASPLVRSTSMSINVPLIDFEYESESTEVFMAFLLKTPENQRPVSVKIAPNPAGDVLNLQSESVIRSVAIADASGRIVLSAENPSGQIATDHFQPGVYFATIATDSGKTTQKFIKK